MKPFPKFTKEQTIDENEPMPFPKGEGMEKLSNFEIELGERQNETLFKITSEIENTENALNQAEQLAQRLKKRLKQLKDLQRVLSR